MSITIRRRQRLPARPPVLVLPMPESTPARRTRLRLAGTVVACLALPSLGAVTSGCGYVLGTSGQADGRGAGTLAELAATRALEVAPFSSATSEGDAAPITTRLARERLALRALPTAPEAAPRLLVGGEVLEVTSLPVAFDAALAPTQWRVRVKLRVDVGTPERVQASATTEASVETPGGTDVQATETARRLALVRALEAALDAAYARLTPR